MIVIIDNYDSFTYNLFQYVGEINQDVRVFRNDKITISELKKMNISHLIISPGPGFPKDAGISVAAIRELGKDIPILGVCLGHQAIAEAFGGRIIHAKDMVHGKTSLIEHNGRELFKGLDNPITATRYHSLIVDDQMIPNDLVVTANSLDGEIMGLKHKEYPTFGVQFHPESIATDGGKQLIRNFLETKVKGKNGRENNA